MSHDTHIQPCNNLGECSSLASDPLRIIKKKCRLALQRSSTYQTVCRLSCRILTFGMKISVFSMFSTNKDTCANWDTEMFRVTKGSSWNIWCLAWSLKHLRRAACFLFFVQTWYAVPFYGSPWCLFVALCFRRKNEKALLPLRVAPGLRTAVEAAQLLLWMPTFFFFDCFSACPCGSVFQVLCENELCGTTLLVCILPDSVSFASSNTKR